MLSSKTLLWQQMAKSKQQELMMWHGKRNNSL